MKDNLICKVLTKEAISEIAVLGQQLNSSLTIKEVETYQKQMFDLSTYYCFGLYKNQDLIGVSSGWITVRLYSGKQLEVDNVVIDGNVQSQGYGKMLFEFIENWAKENECKTIELNTYVQNSRSHKFYFNLGFSILGYHFWKQI